MINNKFVTVGCAWSPDGEYIIYYFSNESAERHAYSVIDKNGILQDDIVEANGFIWNKT